MAYASGLVVCGALCNAAVQSISRLSAGGLNVSPPACPCKVYATCFPAAEVARLPTREISYWQRLYQPVAQAGRLIDQYQSINLRGRIGVETWKRGIMAVMRSWAWVGSSMANFRHRPVRGWARYQAWAGFRISAFVCSLQQPGAIYQGETQIFQSPGS